MTEAVNLATMALLSLLQSPGPIVQMQGVAVASPQLWP